VRRGSAFGLTLLVAVTATAVLALIFFSTRRESSAGPTYAELVAANYRVLSPAESRRLLRFAKSFHACVNRRGISLGPPEPLNTRIEMAIQPAADREALGRVTVSCGESLGRPPPGASLQAVSRDQPDDVVLYLPKQCLLDPKVKS
jgi:hypothetical protein